MQADLSQLKALRSFQMRVRLDDEIAAEAIREAARTRVSFFLGLGSRVHPTLLFVICCTRSLHFLSFDLLIQDTVKD